MKKGKETASPERGIPLKGETIADVLEALFAQEPQLRDELYDGELLRPSISVCLNGIDSRYLALGLKTPVQAGDRVSTCENVTLH
ncbi:molybdopterin converting factor small subunit [Luteibacter sp. Sphag1AF]|uniref:MoaD/ThiS family protein n=1 Tax=Luteibacter sp. Sphag1AF TaxID=2587031 RepID=UPI001618DA14|nr:MoaD/ThiS family protein [Luteibacter sp. Sphag1AF]MBB3228415.1 molybdopterin converting factor small subunit [Luteibacter sp. Sphag1AF]